MQRLELRPFPAQDARVRDLTSPCLFIYFDESSFTASPQFISLQHSAARCLSVIFGWSGDRQSEILNEVNLAAGIVDYLSMTVHLVARHALQFVGFRAGYPICATRDRGIPQIGREFKTISFARSLFILQHLPECLLSFGIKAASRYDYAGEL